MSNESETVDKKLYPDKMRKLAIALEASGMPWEEAFDFISSSKGINERNKKEIGEWFINNLPLIENRIGKDTLKKVRENSACCIGGIRHKIAVKIRKENKTISERLNALSEAKIIIGDSLEIIDNNTFRIHFSTHSQDFNMCSCLKYKKGEQSKPMPITYCNCCGGHIKYHCESALGVKLDENVISSSLSSLGKESCVFELKILSHKK